MKITLPLTQEVQSLPKEDLATALEQELLVFHIHVAEKRIDKPWGIELKISEADTPLFVETFFKKEELPSAVIEHPFGPKILVIEKSKRLSWHVHERKDAFLKSVQGRLHVYTGPTDDETEPVVTEEGTLIHIPELIRHRLGAIDSPAIVAEISRNVFQNHPSDDADERRIRDDFGRV